MNNAIYYGWFSSRSDNEYFTVDLRDNYELPVGKPRIEIASPRIEPFQREREANIGESIQFRTIILEFNVLDNSFKTLALKWTIKMWRKRHRQQGEIGDESQ